VTPKPERDPAPTPHQPLAPSRARNVPSTDWQRSRGWWSRRGKKSAFLWRLDTVSLGKHQRNGVESQDKPSTTAQRIGAHVESTMTRPPCLSLYTCAPFSLAIDRAGPARSTPFLCSCAKKRGGAPKKRAYGCRHGTCSVPPASPTDSKPQHPHRLRQADLSAQTTTRPRPKSGEERNDHQSSSAHADGGAAEVKKRFSLAARHRFFGQAPKKWGRIAGQGNENLPT